MFRWLLTRIYNFLTLIVNSFIWLGAYQYQQTQPIAPAVLSDNIFLDLATKIGNKWTHLAIHLGITDAEIEHLQTDNSHSQERQAFKMLKTWWQRWDHLHDAEETGALNALCDALEKIGRSDLVLRVTCSVEGAGHFNPDPYRDEFIRYYQDEMSVVPLLPWLPTEVSSIYDIYVKLELHEKHGKTRKVKSRTIGSHEDMLNLKYEDGKPVRFILLSGIAGSGKTTIVSKIATDWAEQKPGSPLSKFTFLVALSMRELKGVSDLTEAIYDQILAKDAALSRASLKNYMKTHAEKVLVVFDGADEFDKEGSQLPSDGNIIDIISNKILRGCTVLVTTRPHMVDKLCELNSSFVHIETRGFSDEGVQEYIQKFFEGNDTKVSVGLFRYLNISGKLLSLARTPIMLLLMCLVWSEENKLSETLTELFEDAILFIIKRHFKKSGLLNPDYKRSKVGVLNNLSYLLNALGKVALNGLSLPAQALKFIKRRLKNPGLLKDDDKKSEDSALNKLRYLVHLLGKEALDGLMLPGQKLVFEAGDFGNSEVVDEACKIGILSKEKIRSKLRAVERVTFFHKNFQEAIAGFYWASLAESNEKLFKSYLSMVDRDSALDLEYLMRFCCGGNVKAAESLLRHVADNFSWESPKPFMRTEIENPPFMGRFVSHENRDLDYPFRRLWILMHFEAHSAELHDIAETVFNHVFPVQVTWENELKTALTFLVNCATSSSQSFLTDLEQIDITNVTLKEDLLLATHILEYSPNVGNVSISISELDEEVLNEFWPCKVLSRMQSLEKLRIICPTVHVKHGYDLSVIFNHLSRFSETSLNTLELRSGRINRGDLAIFFITHSKLCELHLHDVISHDDKASQKMNYSVSIHTAALKVLKLVDCGSTALEIIRLFKSYPNLQSLMVRAEDPFNLEHVCNLLSTAPNLRVVDLRGVLIGNAFLDLVKQLKRLTNLQELKLCSLSGLRSEHIVALAKALPLLTKLRVLAVSFGQDKDLIFQQLSILDVIIVSLAIIDLACASRSLKELTFRGCVHLLSALFVNATRYLGPVKIPQPTHSVIEKLDVSGSSFGQCIEVFKYILKQMPLLKQLNMTLMFIKETDWTELLVVLESCQQLQILNLFVSSMDSRAFESVLRLIPRLPDLQWLVLPGVRGESSQMIHDCLQCGERDIFTLFSFNQAEIAALVRVVKRYDME